MTALHCGSRETGTRRHTRLHRRYRWLATHRKRGPRSPGPSQAIARRRGGQAASASASTAPGRLRPACPLLFDDLCSVYEDRPLLCRAYGFPVDAYAVKSDDTIVFRSLCVLYEGMELIDYVRAKDLKGRMAELSQRLAGGHHWGRFTSPEAILSQLEQP